MTAGEEEEAYRKPQMNDELSVRCGREHFVVKLATP